MQYHRFLPGRLRDLWSINRDHGGGTRKVFNSMRALSLPSGTKGAPARVGGSRNLANLCCCLHDMIAAGAVLHVLTRDHWRFTAAICATKTRRWQLRGS